MNINNLWHLLRFSHSLQLLARTLWPWLPCHSFFNPLGIPFIKLINSERRGVDFMASENSRPRHPGSRSALCASQRITAFQQPGPRDTGAVKTR